VVRASRDYNRVTVSDQAALSAENEPRFAFLNAEELVDLWVNFIAYFLAGLQAHHDKLCMLACEQHFSEIIIFLCLLLYVPNISFHNFTSLCN
jgi:hypothetical protein